MLFDLFLHYVADPLERRRKEVELWPPAKTDGAAARRELQRKQRLAKAQARRRRHQPWFPIGYRFTEVFPEGWTKDRVWFEGGKHVSAPILALLCDTCRVSPVARARMTACKRVAPGLGRPGCDMRMCAGGAVLGWQHWLGGECLVWRDAMAACWAAVAGLEFAGAWESAMSYLPWAWLGRPPHVIQW